MIGWKPIKFSKIPKNLKFSKLPLSRPRNGNLRSDWSFYLVGLMPMTVDHFKGLSQVG